MNLSATADPLGSTASAPYLDALNPPQREAVLATDGPVLVLAGAGTGKTRVLTTRIAHLMASKRAWPGQILAVTFTNKAAREMVERVERLVSSPLEEGHNTRGMWLGTFHAIGARILRRHAEAVGLTSTFTILDADDQLRLIKTLLAEQNIDEKQTPPKGVLATIQSWKDRGLVPEKVSAEQVETPNAKTALSIYKVYQPRLRALNAADFGDLLLHNLTLFSTRPEILQEYAQRFRYILVDEYQDTNVAQYLWLRLLSLAHKNICCVGDDDQSIYGWRGAEVGNILRFEKDFPGAKVIRLEQNYRSTKHILAAASALIACNAGRLGKTLWTEGEEGDAIRIKPVWDDMEEARYVGEEVEALQRDQVSLSDMAILVRAGFQTRSFEERLLTLGIPYRVVGGLRFYERMEIRDAIAYLRIVAQPHDDLAFERIINTPKRGVGKATLEQMHAEARGRNTSLTEASKNLLKYDMIKGKAKAALSQLFTDLERWKLAAAALPPAELAKQVLETSGYIAMWQQEKTPEAQGRVENLRELFRALEEFATLGDFLEHVSLVTDTDTIATEDMLNIMTLHAAKGLEFNTVFLAGWEEGLFPHQRALDETGGKGLEEERRLAYVGITRAKRRLHITHAANRRIYNQWQSSIPSRFLGELPEENIEMLEGGAYTSSRSGPALFQKEIDRILVEAERPRWQPPSLREPATAAAADNFIIPGTTESAWTKGQRIFHLKFGYGIILGISGDHLEIAFDKAGRKKVLADYVEKA